MPSSKRRFSIKFLAFFFVLSVLCLGIYRLVKGPTIRADEVRVYRLLPSGKSALQVLVQLHGEAAQEAANNFNYSSSGRYDECLDSEGWFRIVFNYNRKAQTFDVYLHNGQLKPGNDNAFQANHLSEDSRHYYEQLVKGKR